MHHCFGPRLNYQRFPRSPSPSITFKSGGKLFKRLASFENSSLEMESAETTNWREGGIQMGFVQICVIYFALYA